MELIYEYGARAGFWRLHRMFTEADVPVTVYGVATALARSPDQVAAMQAGRLGDRLARAEMDRLPRPCRSRTSARHGREAIRLHAEVTGERPTGWYTGRSSLNTVGSPPRKAASTMSPTPMTTTCPTGSTMTGTATHRPQLIIPYTLDANDMRFATPQGFNSGDQFFAYLKDASTRSMPRARRAGRA